MFYSSWRYIIEAGGKVQVSSDRIPSDGKRDEEFDVQLDKASATMLAFHHPVVLRRELPTKAKLSIFKPSCRQPFQFGGLKKFCEGLKKRQKISTAVAEAKPLHLFSVLFSIF